MKTLISVLLIFAIIIAGGIGCICIVNKYMNTLNEYIDTLELAVRMEDAAMLKQAVEKTDAHWQKMRSVLCLLIKHEYIFEIDSAITELYSFSDSFDSAEATLSVSKARACASCIIETSSFTLENII